MSKTSIKETKEHSNNKESKDFQYYKELAEKYQFQCSLMASEIISLRSSLSKLNFDRAKNLEIDIN